MKKTAIALLLTLPLFADHHAEKKKLYPDTPKLPNVPYTVHDTTRPQPRKVESGGAVSVKAPSDATVIFDGTNNGSWTGGFQVKDGILVAAKGGFKTKDSFRDCQLHIEWRIPADREVDGQKGGNSGVFFMGGIYEVQGHSPTHPLGWGVNAPLSVGSIR